MRAARKRRIVMTVLAFLTLWPAAQFAAVKALDLNPWHWGGWAMYTSVNFLPAIEVFAVRGDSREQLGLGGHGFPASREAREQLVFDVNFYGELADPAPLALAATAETGDGVVIEIVIEQFFLDSNSARVSVARRSHFFEDGLAVRP